MPWGDSFATGLNAGVNLRDRYKQQKRDDRQLDEDIRLHNVNESLVRDRMAADLQKRKDEETALENDPEQKLRRLRAQLETDALNNPQPQTPMAKVRRALPGGSTAEYETPVTDLEKSFAPPPPNPDDVLAADVKRMQLQKEKDALSAPTPPPAAPTAKVTQAFGDGDKSRVEYTLPVDKATKMAASSGYKSPYADDIAELGRTIAQHRAEMDGGDNRTGFLNMNSRGDIVAQAERQRKRLQGLELQHQLDNGVIDEDEANRRATLVLEGSL